MIAVASWPPVRLIGEFGPERLLINFACALIGLGALIDPPAGESVLAHWPRWFVYEWAGAMLFGGCCALWGITRGHRVGEWLGDVCIGCAAFLFVSLSIAELGVSAVRVSLMFAAIAAAKGVRLLLAYAARAVFLRTEAAKDDPARKPS